jgi:hypothetical protein
MHSITQTPSRVNAETRVSPFSGRFDSAILQFDYAMLTNLLGPLTHGILGDYDENIFYSKTLTKRGDAP